MANFKKTGDLYVDKGNSAASDANAGTDPDLPKLTIGGAIDAASDGQKIIVGDNLYSETGWIFGNSAAGKSDITIEGDGIVFIEGDNINDLISTQVDGLTLKNVVIINQSNIINKSGSTGAPIYILLEDSIIINSPIFARKGSGTCAVYSVNSRWINSNYDVITRIQNLTQAFNLEPQINRSVFINSTIKVNVKLLNSYFDSTVELTDDDIVGAYVNIQDSNFNDYISSITYAGVIYPTLAGHQTANPTVDQNSISEDGRFNRVGGEVATLDFSVLGSSPLFGAGENGTNIGNVKRGIQSERFSPSVYNGTVNNIVFDGQRWQILGSNTTGTLESDVIDFGLTVKSPIPTIKGLVNFLDNVPDFNNTLLDPNKLDLEVRYAIIGENISAKAYKTFLFNERLELDNTDKSNGEAGFDWDNTVTIPMKEVQYRITLRQYFNG